MGSLANVDPTYAQHVVSSIDAELADMKVKQKTLTERRKQFVPFLPKKTAD